MPALLLRFGPYAAIALLSVLLYAAKARIDTLDARLDQQAAEFNTRIADGVADAARVAIQEQERAVARERKRWEDLVDANNAAVVAAEQARDAAAVKARDLQNELDEIYRSDTNAKDWRDSPVPAAVLDSLRN